MSFPLVQTFRIKRIISNPGCVGTTEGSRPNPAGRLLQPQCVPAFSGSCGGRDGERQQQSRPRSSTSIQNSNLNYDPGLLLTMICNPDSDIDSHLRLCTPRKNDEEKEEEGGGGMRRRRKRRRKAGHESCANNSNLIRASTLGS